MNIVLRAGARQELLLPPGRWLTTARRCPARIIIATGAEGKELIQQIERRINRARVGVGSEIAVAVTLKTAHTIDAWKSFGERDFDVGIGLIIAQQHIVLGAVLLDIVVL